MMLKVKFIWNLVMLDIPNSSSEIIILSSREVIGILHLRSLDYYKIQQCVLQQSLSKFYNLKSSENVCNEFNNLISTLNKDEKIRQEKNIHGYIIWMRENTCQIEKY